MKFSREDMIGFCKVAINILTENGKYSVGFCQNKNGDRCFYKATKDGELCELVNLSRRAGSDEG